MNTIDMIKLADTNGETYFCKYDCGEIEFSSKQKIFKARWATKSLTIQEIMFDLNGWTKRD